MSLLHCLHEVGVLAGSLICVQMNTASVMSIYINQVWDPAHL